MARDEAAWRKGLFALVQDEARALLPATGMAEATTLSRTQDTQRIAREYFEACTREDSERVRALLSDDFVFVAVGLELRGRDAFLSNLALPRNARRRMVKEAYQDDAAFQMYDAANGGASVRIVECLTVRDGRITDSCLVTDVARLMAFMRGGDVPDDIEDTKRSFPCET
jgi:ketosteroid isomerase-like protein